VSRILFQGRQIGGIAEKNKNKNHVVYFLKRQVSLNRLALHQGLNVEFDI